MSRVNDPRAKTMVVFLFEILTILLLGISFVKYSFYFFMLSICKNSPCFHFYSLIFAMSFP